MVELFANGGDPDQTPRSVASDLDLHCLPITLLGVSRLQWVKPELKTNPKILYLNSCHTYSKGLKISFSARQAISEKGSILKGKKFLPQREAKQI